MNDNILGSFVSITNPYSDATQEEKETAFEQGELFRLYIWGGKGICDKLKKLHHVNYGKDIKLVLFQFYVNPISFELEHLKEIESYRKKEKSIGIPIIVNEEKFSVDLKWSDTHFFSNQFFLS